MNRAAVAGTLRSIARWSGEIGHQFQRRQCASHAASLTFTTLFALVPFTAVIYGVLSALPGFGDIAGLLRGFLFENFVPASAGRIEEFLIEFSDQARNLTFAGVILLIVSTIILMMSVEHAFNHVWGVTEARRGLVRLVAYWGVITLGPVLVGIGFLASSYLATLPLLAEAGIEPLRLTIMEYLPELSGFFAFSLLFYAVPNCRVPPLHALAGGLVATLLFEFAKSLFTATMGIGNLNVIYGAFAVLPLFLVWVYLVWSIILGCAIIVAGLSPDLDRDTRGTPMLLKCLWILEILAILHPKGSLPRELQRQADLTRSQWSEALDALLCLGLVTQQGQFLLLGESVRSLPLLDLYQRLPTGVTVEALRSYQGSQEMVAPLIDFLQQGEDILSEPMRLPTATNRETGA